MSDEKYLNHYVEILTSTMTDVIVRNISMQANARVSEEVIAEQAKRIEELSVNVANSSAQSNSEIAKLNETIGQLNNELNDLRRQRGEFEATKSQAQHVNTFRNELAKAQETIKELNDKIEYLQLTPAKRKKIDEANKPKEETKEVFVTGLQVVEGPVTQSTDDTIKDGGSF